MYNNIEHHFAEYLETLLETLINEIEKDLRLNLYSFIDTQNELSSEEIYHAFEQFYYRFFRFPCSNNLLVVLKGEIPYFVNSKISFRRLNFIKSFK